MLKINFGRQLKHESFNLDPDYYFTNHGSYGSVPKSILNKKIQLQHELEKSPDKWFRYTSYDLYNKNVETLANYLKINAKNLVLCDNATDAINVAMRAIEFDGSNDAILATSYTYQAILNTIDYTSKYRLDKENHVNVFKVDIKFPIKTVDELFTAFEDKIKEILIEKKLRLRLAVIDHISSATAMLFPVDKICQLIRKWSQNSLILIDGAHAIGNLN